MSACPSQITGPECRRKRWPEPLNPSSRQSPSARAQASGFPWFMALPRSLAAVLITGYADAIDSGGSTLPVLAKPFRAAELARAVAEAIKGSAAI